MGDMLNTRPGAPNDPTTGQASSGAGELLPPIKPPLALVGERLKRGLPLPPEYQAARASHFWPLLPHPAWHPFKFAEIENIQRTAQRIEPHINWPRQRLTDKRMQRPIRWIDARH